MESVKNDKFKISLVKKIGYRLYGILYSLYKVFPSDAKRVYFIMTHDASDEGNCGVMKKYIESKKQGYKCIILKREQTERRSVAGIISFVAGSAWNLARSRYVFMDNAFLPLAYLKLRKGTQLVQLWHGTGTIKRFGQHVNEGELGELERRANENITLLAVSSHATKKLYAECFGVRQNIVKVLGLPRTDCFFDKDFAHKARVKLEKAYPGLAGRKLVLYVPTFRDDTLKSEKPPLDIALLMQQLPLDICLGLRLHPFLQSSFGVDEAAYDERILDFSSYEGVNTLLGAADILVTDYSSIIFEYCVLDRPMIFFSYDLDRFEGEGRGFYRNYTEYVPGPVVKNTKELLGCIYTGLFEDEKRAGFTKEAYTYQDGRSCERIYNEVFRNRTDQGNP